MLERAASETSIQARAGAGVVGPRHLGLALAMAVVLPLGIATIGGVPEVASGRVGDGGLCYQDRIFAPYAHSYRASGAATGDPSATSAAPTRLPPCTPSPEASPTRAATDEPATARPTETASAAVPATGTASATVRPSETSTQSPPSATPSATVAPSGTATTRVPPSATSTSTMTTAPTNTATATATVAPPTAVPTEPSPTAPPPDGDSPRLGIQVFEGDLGAIAAGRLEDGGAGWARARIMWAAVEPDRDGARTWGMSDATIGAIAARGVRPMVSVYKWPTWVGGSACGPLDATAMERYEAFLSEAVERYDGDGLRDAPSSPRIRVWEIGNEPDFAPSEAAGEGDYGSCFGDAPQAYADLLRRSYGVVRASDPSARVMFGGVAYDRFADHPDPPPGVPTGPFRYGFVRDVLDALHVGYGGHPDFPFWDVMGIHSYNDFRNAWDGPGGEMPEIVGKVHAFRQAQLLAPGDYDLRGMPLASTEISLASAPTDDYTVRSEDYQAAYASQAAIRALAADLEFAIWYTAVDYTGGNCDDLYSWLLLGAVRSTHVAELARACPENPLPGYAPAGEWEAKQSLAALATAAQWLEGAAYGGQLTASDTGDASIEAHRLTLDGGRPALAAFTDHGERLGRKGSPDRERTWSIGPEHLTGWTGKLRVADHLGAVRIMEGDRVDVRITFRPQLILVEP